MKLFICYLFACQLSLCCGPAVAAELPGIADFIDEMVDKYQFDREQLTLLFAQADDKPQIIEAISRPATLKPWLEYRAAFVNQSRIRQGMLFWKKYHLSLERAEKQFAVPQSIIVAVLGIETLYGQQTGQFRTIDALTTLAFDYPRRADFFRTELENYLLLAREQNFDYLALKSSYAGAMGIPQFMPSSYRKYALDYNGNHHIDLLHEPVDAIGSVANYLKNFGWVKGGLIAVRVQAEANCCDNSLARSTADWAALGVVPDSPRSEQATSRLLTYTLAEGHEYWLGFNNFDVITCYNNSDYYAMTVFQLAEALKTAYQSTLKSPPKSRRKMSCQKRHKTSKMQAK